MSPEALIRQAQEVGVELRLVDGKVRASGTRSAVTSMLELLRQHRTALIEAMSPEPPSNPASWHSLARAYYAHHFKCPTCIAAGLGYGLRCGVGAALWRNYCR